MADQTPCEQLATAVGAGGSKIVAAIFDVLTDEAEARMLIAASPPATVEEMAGKTGLPLEVVESRVDPLFKKGLLLKTKKKDGIRYYRVRHLMQFHDATAVAVDPPQEMLDLWKKYMQEEWSEDGKKFETLLPGSVMRVIPVNESIESSSQIMAFEDLEELIQGAEKLAVTPCSCRVIDGACGKSVEVCIQVNRAADYALERGTGREVTKREALDILAKSAEEGLVHVADNRRSLGHVICNCCNDCCINWASLRTGLGKLVAPSRFQAEVDPDECNGCELCLDRCYFEAMSMDEEEAVAMVEPDNCMGCGLCQVICPTDAIELLAVRPEGFVPE